jgi:hypothetical protein
VIRQRRSPILPYAIDRLALKLAVLGIELGQPLSHLEVALIDPKRLVELALCLQNIGAGRH